MLPRPHWLPSRRRILGALLNDPGAPVALLARDGRVLQSGAAFRALAGPLPVLSEPVRGDLAAALRQAAPFQAVAELLTQDGACPVSVSLQPTGLDTPAAVLRLTDLRPQRALEERLAQAQRLQSVGQLAAGVAHDFNNLLTAILGAAEALEPRLDAGSAEDLAHIRQAAERGAALVRQLLAFGRQQTLQPRLLALNDTVRRSAGLLACLLGGTTALALELEEPGCQVRMDPTQLDQVLLNLAANAQAAMPAGGTLTVATARRQIFSPETEGADTIPPGRYAVIEVRDTGAGIPPDVLPHIFEPFFTTRRGAGGTGLGLATVHGIVRQSGGFLAVRSRPGAGTAFRITLPRQKGEVAAPQPSHAAPAGRRLLLVDDEAPVRRLAARALIRAGWEVIEAASGGEALEAGTEGVAQVVSDVVMPGMDGPSLVRELRRRVPGLRAVLMSGYADAAQRQALAAQDIAFLAKPFSMARLVELVGTPADAPDACVPASA